MISAGEVGAVFKIVDEGSPALKALMDQFNALQGVIDRTKLALRDLKLPTGLSRSADKVAASIEGVAFQAEKTAGTVSTSFEGMDRAAAATQGIVARLGREFQAVAAESKALGRTSVVRGPATRSMPRVATLDKMNEALKRVADQSLATADAFGANFARIEESVDKATGGVRALTAELRAAGIETRAIKFPSLPSGARSIRNGDHAGEMHVAGPGIPLGAGYHARGASLPEMAAAGALAYGVYQEAQVEDVAARAMLTGQIKTDAGMTDTAAFKSIRDMIQRVSSKTGYSPKDVGEAILTTERQFGGLSFKDRLGIEETLIPYAAAEARMKEATLAEAFEAMVGLSHMTGTYDPKQLPELMRQFQYASMITPVGINQFRGALSYSLPMLHAGLDMDPSAAMFLTAMTQTAGITNTKSGTWLRAFFENSEPRIGEHLSKQALMHNEALEKIGLLDAHDRVTWQVKGAGGKTDWDASILKMSQLINKFTQATDPAVRLSTLRTAFGERGGGEAALMNLSQFIEQFPVLQKKMKEFQGGDDVLKALSDASPVQQARNAFADLENVLMDIGQSVLPPLTGALSGLDSVLKKIKETTGETAGNSIIGTGFLAGVSAWFLRRPLGHLLSSLSDHAAPATTSVAEKVAAAAPYGLSDLFGGVKSALTGGAAAGIIAVASDYVHGEAMDALGKWLASTGLVDTSAAAQERRSREFDSKVLGIAPHGRSPKELSEAMESWWPSIGSEAQWQLSLQRSGYTGKSLAAELDRESSRAAALTKLPTPPTPIVDTKVDVKVLLDGRAIAAVIEKNIVIQNRTTNSASGFDGRAGFAGPGVRQ